MKFIFKLKYIHMHCEMKVERDYEGKKEGKKELGE